MTKPKSKKFDEWEIEEALRTITRAEEIKQDKALMGALKPHFKKRKDAVNSAAEILYGKGKVK